MNKKNICFIRAKLKKDYVFDGIKKSGFDIRIPYKDKNILLRLLREAWFRSKLPKRSLWYNSELKKIQSNIIIVKDPLITPDFLKWLRLYHKDKKIILDYDNRVHNSINPKLIRKYMDEIWSYDQNDCDKYGLRKKGEAYLDIYRINKKCPKKYDVFYVGRDKGRLDQIHIFEKKLKEQGLKTYFYICADREFLTWKKKEYKHFLPYEKYLNLLSRSRAILNIVPEGQTSITQREMEAVFFNVKCITNNVGIKKFKLYDSSRYFVLDDNFDEINTFMDKPFKPIQKSELSGYRFVDFLEKMLKE